MFEEKVMKKWKYLKKDANGKEIEVYSYLQCPRCLGTGSYNFWPTFECIACGYEEVLIEEIPNKPTYSRRY